MEVQRIGKYNQSNSERERGREGQNPNLHPLLVKMTYIKMKWNIIKGAKRMRENTNETMRKIRIVPDLTRNEREMDRTLREELKAKRDAGEMDQYIRRGKLHKRTFYQE